LTPKQANIIKQEMLSKGGDAAVTRGTVDASVPKTDMLLMGTEKQYQALFKKKLVMGILNVTPDSFTDGGQYNNLDAALAHARRMVDEGADIIDVGGESTRPGYAPVSAEDEIKRVLPVVEALLGELDIPISVDTTKAAVARKVLAAGAHMINDQWSLRADPDMAQVVAEYEVPVVLMHNRQDHRGYRDLMGEIVDFLRESVAMAEQAGISREKIIIDPGFGLGKIYDQNLELMQRLRELDCLGLPVLLGPSRKSTIGKVLDLPVDQRVEGTGAMVALGIASGVEIVRVHDVKEMVRVARMTDAVVHYTIP
jgi:dihydropteroate synthase